MAARRIEIVLHARITGTGTLMVSAGSLLCTG